MRRPEELDRRATSIQALYRCFWAREGRVGGRALDLRRPISRAFPDHHKKSRDAAHGRGDGWLRLLADFNPRLRGFVWDVAEVTGSEIRCAKADSIPGPTSRPILYLCPQRQPPCRRPGRRRLWSPWSRLRTKAHRTGSTWTLCRDFQQALRHHCHLSVRAMRAGMRRSRLCCLQSSLSCCCQTSCRPVEQGAWGRCGGLMAACLRPVCISCSSLSPCYPGKGERLAW